MDRIKTYTLLAKPYWLKINFVRLTLIGQTKSATSTGKVLLAIFLERKSYFMVQILQNTFESQGSREDFVLATDPSHFLLCRTIMHNGTRAGVSLVFYEVIPVLLLSSSFSLGGAAASKDCCQCTFLKYCTSTSKSSLR